MALRIGIIGAENSHSAAIAKTINVEGKIRGQRVTCIWGETPELARKVATATDIPTIVRDPREMIGQIDALIVDHRHPRHHLPAARPFLAEGIPMFIDKPFCFSASEGRQFLRDARKHGCAVTCLSALPLQASFGRLMRKLKEIGPVRSACCFAPCDVDSPHGGVFFYGVHVVEIALSAFGMDVEEIRAVRNGRTASCELTFSDERLVTFKLHAESCSAFAVSAAGDGGCIHQDLTFDKDLYLKGIKEFTTMFRTAREPLAHERILRSVEVLEAMARALSTGRKQRLSPPKA